MRYEPKAKNKIAPVAAIVLTVTAVILFCFSAQPSLKGAAAVQLLSFATLAVAVFFMLKKVTRYVYIVHPKDAENEEDMKKPAGALSPKDLAFTVAKKRGKSREDYMVMLDLSSLRKFKRLPSDKAEQKKLIKEQGRMSVYRYTATLGGDPELYLAVFSKVGYDKVGVIIEAEGEFPSYLRTVVEINKNTPDEDEDEN